MIVTIFTVSHLQAELEDYLEDDYTPHHYRFRRDSDDDHEIVSDDQFKCKQQSRKVNWV